MLTVQLPRRSGSPMDVAAPPSTAARRSRHAASGLQVQQQGAVEHAPPRQAGSPAKRCLRAAFRRFSSGVSANRTCGSRASVSTNEMRQRRRNLQHLGHHEPVHDCGKGRSCNRLRIGQVL